MAIKGLKELVERIRKEQAITAEQVEDELNKVLPTDWVPKSTFNEQGEKLKQATKAGEDNARLLKDLQEKAGLTDEYKTKISELSASQKKAEAEYLATITGMKMDSAIERTLSKAKARDTGIVSKIIDRSKLKLNDDGTLTGLDEQLAAMKKGSAFLFEEEQPTPPPKPNVPKPTFFMGGGTPPNGGAGGTGGDDKAALMAAFGVVPTGK